MHNTLNMYVGMVDHNNGMKKDNKTNFRDNCMVQYTFRL